MIFKNPKNLENSKESKASISDLNSLLLQNLKPTTSSTNKKSNNYNSSDPIKPNNLLPSLNNFLEKSKAFSDSLKVVNQRAKLETEKMDFEENKQKDNSLTPPLLGADGHSGEDETDIKRLRPKRGQYR